VEYKKRSILNKKSPDAKSDSSLPSSGNILYKMERAEIEGCFGSPQSSGICAAQKYATLFSFLFLVDIRIYQDFFASKYPVTLTLRHPDSRFLHIRINSLSRKCKN